MLGIRYPSAPLAKSIIHPGGFNWVLIDGEHGLINDSNYYEVSPLHSTSLFTELAMEDAICRFLLSLRLVLTAVL